jgi:hypothetical protein
MREWLIKVAGLSVTTGLVVSGLAKLWSAVVSSSLDYLALKWSVIGVSQILVACGLWVVRTRAVAAWCAFFIFAGAFGYAVVAFILGSRTCDCLGSFSSPPSGSLLASAVLLLCSVSSVYSCSVLRAKGVDLWPAHCVF